MALDREFLFWESAKNMATHIWVEKAKPFQLSVMLPRVSESLRLILGLTYTPTLVGVQRWKPAEPLPERYPVELDSDGFGIKINGELAMVSVAPSEKYGAICISPDGWRSKLESVLAAAVAIAISEYSESQISDPALAYTKEASQPVKAFAESLKVDMIFNDINEAAELLFSRLPMSAEQEAEGMDENAAYDR